MTRLVFSGALVLTALSVGGCDTRTPGAPSTTPSASVARQVTVDADTPLAVVPPFAYGLHTSVYDNALHDPAVPGLLDEAGITLLRYPGGGYADNYHWASHTLSPFHSGGEASEGYLAPQSDFGSYVSVLGSFGGSAMVTVNYGTNRDGTGPGEPKEAAAWVAYANGEPSDTTLIGEDGSGTDWKTAGHWASLRAAEPLADDDGQNFLRIGRREPLGIVHWEIGNELFGNGYYGQNFEEDLHAPYATSEPYDNRSRRRVPELSGATYGAGVVSYARAMRAIDPDIQVGAVLATRFDFYGTDWNRAVLAEAGEAIDFGIVHYYPGQDPVSLLAAPRREIASAIADLRATVAELAPNRVDALELAVTEVGASPGLDWSAYPSVALQAQGLFALEAYLGFLEQGVANVDWLELHNGSFLSERSARKGPAFHGISLASRLAAPGDTLVTVHSASAAVVAHAARRTDGTLGVLVVNTQAPAPTDAEPLPPLVAPLLLASGELPTSGVRYDYVPVLDGPGVLEGPTPFDDLGSPPALSLAPYQATLLVFSP